MNQLGNLAVAVAQRKNVLFQLLDGQVTVFVGEGPNRTSMSANWADDMKISKMIHELDSGKYTEKAMHRAA